MEREKRSFQEIAFMFPELVFRGSVSIVSGFEHLAGSNLGNPNHF
jgi:hypothetical protein